MRTLSKLAMFLVLVCIGPVAAALFGALHDQLSYTVAPEYFTRFKFVQFAWVGVDAMTPRLGAAVVGMLATWWVGLGASLILGTVALRYPTALEMLRTTSRGFGFVAIVAAITGFIGLVAGWLVFDPMQQYVDWWRPAALQAPRRFFAVGMMHNGSYLGGAIGLIIATIRLWRRRGSPATSARFPATLRSPAS